MSWVTGKLEVQGFPEGCIHDPTVFRHLYRVTEGNPCGTCEQVYTAEGCVPFMQYHTDTKAKLRVLQKREPTVPHNVLPGHPYAGMTIREIAAKLGVSIAEVRRRKFAGTL